MLLLLALAPTSPAAATPPSATHLEAQISKVQEQLATEVQLRQQQSNDTNVSLTAVTVMVGAAALFIAFGALISGFFGYRLIRNYVQDQFDSRIAEVFDQKGQPIVTERLDKAIESYDEQLARLVETANKGLG